MFTIKQYQDIRKNGITFKLSKNKSYANVYRKEKFVGTLYNTKNTIYFCGKEFIETTSKEIIEFLRAVDMLK